MGIRTALFSRKQSGGVLTIYGIDQHPGDIFFVNSTGGVDAAGYGGSPDQPVATIDYAIGLCTANAGDVIYVAPGHTETIAAAGGIAADVAGISIIGQGRGSKRPLISFSATNSTFAISAANVLVKNIQCTPSIDEVVSMFVITGAYCTLDGVDHIDAGASLQTIQFVLTTNAADWLEIKNCTWILLTAPTATSVWISLVGPEGVNIHDNFARLVLANAAGAFTIGGGTDPPYAHIHHNTFVQTGGTTQAAAIKLTTGTGAMVHDNRCAVGSTALAGIVAVGSAGYGAENYALNTPAVSGLLDPVADS